MDIFLETKRLILRQFTELDADFLWNLDNDPRVMKYINGGHPTPKEVIQTQTLPRFMRYYSRYSYFGVWAVVEKATGELMGWVHFFPAIDHPFAVALNLVQPNEIALGYRFIYNSWGKGYATESCQILVDQGFSEWRVKRVIAWALVANKGSIRVMEKLGLTLEKQFRFSQHQLPYFSFEERQAVKYSRSRSEIPPETGFFR
ncbi:GNAT family N-acetyltransferase [Planktothrix agardhii]|uniref:GNAT family N-acetyltransferase n=1 Tax=Planktothrix agardhii TaxID=1160 RepID=UPI0004090135|nr:GNAT family N-acetyltransferase [Planktothrix agardhii]CAD0226691.1 putative acetyltransferase [Planktothrix agardhii]CAD5951828.1 hypothetical protein NO758_02584 [Planktothrix agardhii]